MDERLTRNMYHLLKWLDKDDGQYGECKGTTLDAAMDAGLARWRANSQRNDWGWIEITPAGRAALQERVPMTKKRGPPVRVPVKGDPLILKLYKLINDSEMTLTQVAEAAGLDRYQVAHFKRRSPRIDDFNALLQVIGFELRICRKDAPR